VAGAYRFRPGARFLVDGHNLRQQDHYAVLGVTREASDAEIKQAFRRLARRLHPDVARQPREGAFHDGAFHEVVAAYQVLSHPRRRVLYDRLGLGGRRRQAARPAPAIPPIELRLEWYEAERGASKPLEFEESVACDGCDARGFQRGVLPGVCVRCRGSGRLSTLTESETLRYLEVATCAACEGRGHEPFPACTTCAGTGGRLEMQTIRIRTPPGVRDGDQLRVEGIERRFLLRVGRRPRDSRLVLAAAAVALLGAIAMLLFLVLH
jgi:molecular chaperone DnaJ